MERVTPIHVVEHQFRLRGVFLLVGLNGRRLWFYGYKKDQSELKQMMDSMIGRRGEMVKFLTTRARARGETT